METPKSLSTRLPRKALQRTGGEEAIAKNRDDSAAFFCGLPLQAGMLMTGIGDTVHNHANSHMRRLALTNTFSKLAGRLAIVAALLLASAIPGAADDFYKGKTIRVIVAFGPGGNYDFYARMLARYMGQHIPGHPTVVAENMPGAGSMTAANYVYAVAPKDGTVLAAFDQMSPMHQALGGSGAQFQTANLQWLGSMAHSNTTVYTWYTSGIKTIEDAKKQDVSMGAVAMSDDSYIFPTIINGVLGTRFKVALGYPDSHSTGMAIERGEVAGTGGSSWLSLLTNRRSWIDEKKINLLVQIGAEKEKDLPDVPLLGDLVKDTEGRELSDLVSASTSIGYTYWLAPGVPADRVAILRAAFDATLKNPDLLAETAKLGSQIRPQSAAEIEAQVQLITNTPQPVLDRTAKMLGLHN